MGKGEVEDGGKREKRIVKGVGNREVRKREVYR